MCSCLVYHQNFPATSWLIFCIVACMSALAEQPSSQTIAKKSTTGQWSRELNDLIRGMSGGFLFGIPLLYTMEVWWIGSTASPARILVALAATFITVALLIRTAGFRRVSHMRLTDALMDSVEAIAIGIICTTIVLVLLREITSDTALNEIVGKVVFESVPFALGVALANHLLPRPSDDQEQQARNGNEAATLNATLADIGATVVGAIFVAFNIAPTDEVSMLAAAVSPSGLLAILVASLLISYAIVFEAGFADQPRRAQQRGVFQQPLSETIASYLVSLAAAAFMLWFFQQLSLADPWQMWLSHSLILGLPATVGGAAGRLTV